MFLSGWKLLRPTSKSSLEPPALVRVSGPCCSPPPLTPRVLLCSCQPGLAVAVTVLLSRRVRALGGLLCVPHEHVDSVARWPQSLKGTGLVGNSGASPAAPPTCLQLCVGRRGTPLDAACLQGARLAGPVAAPTAVEAAAASVSVISDRGRHWEPQRPCLASRFSFLPH